MKFKFILLFLIPAFLNMLGQESGQKMTQKEIKLLVDSIDKILNRAYVYPDKAVIMSQAVKSSFKKGSYNNSKDRFELSMRLNSDIQKAHKDGHLHVYYDPPFAKNLETPFSDSLQKVEEQGMIKNAQENNFRFVKAEILPGNVGYLRWDGFEGCTQEAIPTFNSAFLFVLNAKALIIDMRFNNGGSPETVLAAQNYFFNQKVPMNHIIGRNLDTAKRYTDPAKTTFKLNMPVYILTSRSTFSGAEDFTYGLKYAKRATIVGDTTGGGAHPTGPYSLGQGFVITIPGYRSYHEITKTDWEGTGVIPDVTITSEKALSKAQALILIEALSKTNDKEERNKLQWNINGLRPKLMQKDSIKLSKETLLKFCGEYMPAVKDGRTAPLSIILSCDGIYRRFNGGADVPLIPISDKKFLYGDDTGKTMEFVVDKDGNVIGSIIKWWTGEFAFNKK